MRQTNRKIINVKQPEREFWEAEQQPISVVINGLCNHADYRFDTDEACDYQSEAISGVPQPLYDRQIIVCNRCQAWKYCDGILVNSWLDEHFEEAEDD